MKRFHFTLERLYTLRKRQEEERKNELAEVVGEYNKEEQAKNDCMRRIDRNARDLDNLPGTEALSLVTNIDAINVALQNEIRHHEENMATIQSRMREKQKNLANARAQRRVVEIIRDKQYEAYKKLLKREEQHQLDDWRKENVFGAKTEKKNEETTYKEPPRTLLEKYEREGRRI